MAEVISGPQDVPAGKVPLVIDAAFRSPAGAVTRVRTAVAGLDAQYVAASDVRADLAAWLEGAECAELRRQAAFAGCALALILRERHNPAAQEHARLRRLYRQTFNPDA